MAGNPASTRILTSSAEAICAATDAEQGLAMLQALDDETALADVARNAKLWEVRLAAVQRVTDSALLERIAEATKHRDDRVYRYSYDVLRLRRRDLARAKQMNGLQRCSPFHFRAGKPSHTMYIRTFDR
jgi:hypothetical protein